MTVLVTGAAGFIGRWVVGELLDRDVEVLAVDDLSAGDRTNLDEFERHPRYLGLEEADVRSAADVDSWFGRSWRIDAVAHLAASISVQDSIDDPASTFDNDVVGTFRVLEAARRVGARFLFMSTCMVYDRTPDGGAIAETHRTKPASPYAASKLAGEALTLSYGHAYGLPVVVVRPFNTYGPYQRSVGEGGVVAIFTRRSLLGDDLRIYGDGTQTRDLLYVADCARFVSDALLEERAAGLVLNAGTGHDVSVNELATAIEPDPSRIVHVPHIHPQSEIAVLRCDSGLAHRVLGWRASVTLADGLSRVREHMAARLAAGEPVA
jgi:UDP-glucose 4-epimerase